MKRIICLSFCILMIISNTGCNKKSSDVTAVTTGLSFTAEISCLDTELVCFTEIAQNGKADFTVLSPEEIDGLKFSFEGENITAEYKGLIYTPQTELPQTAVLSVVYSILRDNEKNKNDVVYTDGIFTLSGSIDKIDYTLQLGETGLPIKIICSEKSLEVAIKNAVII